MSTDGSNSEPMGVGDIVDEQPQPETRPGGVEAGRLRSFIERVERLEDEKAMRALDIREVFAEAKNQGFDAKAMRKIIKLRAMDSTRRKEEAAMIEMYAHAMGLEDILF
ncbi:MAG TPA: DUF2312 domain-containing protein [Alphaproteobacteria bacterium]|nr:DUF2312 domain-containing protein [Alphaproteobacteria bacterium]